MDYHSEYIKNYRKYLPDLMTKDGYYEYAIQVFDYLETMLPGKVLNLKADDPDKLKWLLVTAAAFLMSGEHWMDYELNDDFTKVRHIDVPENFRKLMRA